MGYSRSSLYNLRDKGKLIQTAPGLFKHPSVEITENTDFAEVAKLVPQGVITLTSALQFHTLGTEMPPQIWVALNRDDTRTAPSSPSVSTKFVWFSGPAFSEGQEVHLVEGVEVKVYSPAKTIADLFKYRNKIGLDVALASLREGWSDKRFTIDELMHFAEICRVEKVLEPHLRGLVMQ